MTAAEARRALLRDGALLTGASWARGVCDAVRREGRPIAGGWPGTMPEARARIRAYFEAELSRKGFEGISVEEVQFASSLAYQRAKHDWRQYEPDGDEDEETGDSDED